MTGRYVLHHEGTWSYYLGIDAPFARPGSAAYADGEAMEPCAATGWCSALHEARVITLSRPRPDEVISYAIKDADTVSARYPASLTIDGYHELQMAADDESEVLYRLYSPVMIQRDPEVSEIAGPWLRLDGEPPPQDGRSWTAQLPYDLRYRPEYLHLFPGYMPCFREHIGQVLKGLPRVRYVFDLKQWSNGTPYGFEVTLEIPFDVPQTAYRPASNLDGSVSRSRKGRTVPVLAPRKLAFPVPYRIDAANRAEAAAEWDRREAEIRSAVAEASVTACSACMGTGHVISGSEACEKATP